MKIFNNVDEIQKFYNKKTNTYKFVENGKILDVKFNFDLNIDANILAGNIIARNIKALDISTRDILACYITARHITAWDIKVYYISAWDITAKNITANVIEYHTVCYVYKNITCQAIRGYRKNSEHFCLDGEIIIRGENEDVCIESSKCCCIFGEVIKKQNDFKEHFDRFYGEELKRIKETENIDDEKANQILKKQLEIVTKTLFKK